MVWDRLLHVIATFILNPKQFTYEQGTFIFKFDYFCIWILMFYQGPKSHMWKQILKYLLIFFCL